MIFKDYMFCGVNQPDFLAFFNNVAKSLEASDFSPSIAESLASDTRFIKHSSREHTVSTAASMGKK